MLKNARKKRFKAIDGIKVCITKPRVTILVWPVRSDMAISFRKLFGSSLDFSFSAIGLLFQLKAQCFCLRYSLKLFFIKDYLSE